MLLWCFDSTITEGDWFWLFECCYAILICIEIGMNVVMKFWFDYVQRVIEKDGEDLLYWSWICWWSNNSSDRTQMSTHVYCRSRWHLCPTYQRMEQWSGSPSTSLALKTSSRNAETKTSSSVTGADLLLLSFPYADLIPKVRTVVIFSSFFQFHFIVGVSS